MPHNYVRYVKLFPGCKTFDYLLRQSTKTKQNVINLSRKRYIHVQPAAVLIHNQMQSVTFKMIESEITI